jgi:hypothetical protein
MAIVKLGKRPETFSHICKFPMLEGGEGTVPVTYKYRTRKEFGAFWDELTGSTEAAAKSDKPDSTDPVEKFSLAKIYAKASTKNSQDVLKIITGWGLEEELSLESVQQLNDELPLAVATIVGDYYTAMTTGRLGN